jgi:vancomycin aglycone glucosyltransferase
MMQNPMKAMSQAVEYIAQVFDDKSTTLMSVADGADLLVAGISEQGLAANIAEYYGIPLAALHFYPAEILESSGPRKLATRGPERAQRQALGLPEATGRPVDRVALEIQAYDELCVPGLAADWAQEDGNATDLLRLWQHADRIPRRHGRRDQRGVQTFRGTSVDLRGPE